MRLDAYLLGVVPGEMPKEWPAAALQAQAVAARSYALASIVKNRDFDLYADPRSQMYYGVAAESPATTAAVQATKGRDPHLRGKVATRSTTRRRVAARRRARTSSGSSCPISSHAPDPWDTRLAVPPLGAALVHGRSTLAQAFGLSAPVVDVVVVPTASGRPASVTLVKKTGEKILLKAADVRARLGLRSTAFRLGVLRVAPPPASPRGREHRSSSPAWPATSQAPLLEKLGADGAWLPSVKVAPDADGSFAVTVRPKITATYRLTAEGQAGPALTITVPAGQPK